MTKQEEIRERIADIVWKQTMALLGGDSDVLEDIDTSNFMYGKVAAQKILSYLHSHGVVIKVEYTHEGHPHCQGCYWRNKTVEPLIEEE